MDVLITLPSHINVEDTNTFVVQQCIRLSDDSSWRIRFKVAEKINDLAKLLDKEIVKR